MAFADGTVDFRSDTVTRPTGAMKRAMVQAPLGDDVYRDDPTVNALEGDCAELVGKDAAIFMPSGTMANQLALIALTQPGEEVLAHEASHVRSVEAGGPQALAGVGFRTVAHEGGRIEPEDVESAMAMAGYFPRISLMWWENTHNMSGGRVVPVQLMEETSALAHNHALSVHIDGARIFNACLASGVGVERYAATGDTIQFCFSKGLGAPVGSILCGPSELIDEVRYLRKRMGGGMRQAGVLAAAARVGLADRGRLVEDHKLAGGLAKEFDDRFPGSVDLAATETNMVRVDFGVLDLSWPELNDRLLAAGIRTNPPRSGFWRLVTHRDVDEQDVRRLLAQTGP